MSTKSILMLILFWLMLVACAKFALTQDTDNDGEFETLINQLRTSEAYGFWNDHPDTFISRKYWIPAEFYVYGTERRDDTIWAADQEDVDSMVVYLNRVLDPAFGVYVEGVNFVVDSLLFYWQFGGSYQKRWEEQQSAGDPYTWKCHVVGVMNPPFAGYASFPPGLFRAVILSPYFRIYRSTVAHELGHNLGLKHTHGCGHPCGMELVDGSNCRDHGDDICDTPADPNLIYATTSACVYLDDIRDDNGDLYAPDMDNMMSYADKRCRTRFTTMQFLAMQYFFRNWRSDGVPLSVVNWPELELSIANGYIYTGLTLPYVGYNWSGQVVEAGNLRMGMKVSRHTDFIVIYDGKFHYAFRVK